MPSPPKCPSAPYYQKRDSAANQLLEFSKTNEDTPTTTTTTGGNPVPYDNASLTVGKNGPTLLQDLVLIDELSHFSRERNPERVVHAKGAGAFGYFEVTNDITQYSAAKPFAQIGKRTHIAMRFSQVFGEMGYADTVRDVRGFAMKFYTEDGIWDLVGNNTPIFFIRDAILFPSFIHILKRNPMTHLHDWDMFWDFMTLRPETIHQLMIFFSDRGIPDSYRRMHGYGSNTYSFVNAEGQVHYCKFHMITNQGIGWLSQTDATTKAGQDADFLLRDLYNSIAKGDFPSWKMYVQVMTPEQASSYKYNPFDVTKVWLHADYPLIPVGRFVLNRNAKNYFAEIEQLSFDPAHLIPGIDSSPDRMLQGRLFNYGDTARYRLGPNNLQLPVNSPFRVNDYERDGYGTIDNQGGAPNYHPNSFGGPQPSKRAADLTPLIPLVGNAGRYDNGDDDNFSQARLLYQRVLDAEERGRLIENAVTNVIQASDFLQERAVKMFASVDADLGARIQDGLTKLKAKQTHARSFADI